MSSWEAVRVVVSAPVHGTFDYGVPLLWRGKLAAGTRVIVPFGHRRAIGFVLGGAESREDLVLKEIAAVPEGPPSLDPVFLRLLVRLAEYYLVPPGELLRVALPVGAGGRVRRIATLTEAGREALDREGEGSLFAPAPARTSSPIDALGRLAAAGGSMRLGGRALATGLARTLQSRGWIAIREEEERSPAQRSVVRVRAVEQPLSEDSLARAPRRAALLARLREAGGFVPLSDLAAGDSGARSQVRALHAMGLVEIERTGLEPCTDVVEAERSRPPLPTPAQAAALATIDRAIDARSFAPFLIFGVTGSGKTEVYLQAVERTLRGGRDAVVLVPEIALTPQLTARFRARFGDEVAVLHSGLADAARRSAWSRLRSRQARIALGARSAIFAPVAEPGILVVDEEHDGSFKQEDGVRYHARDVALLRGQETGAVVLLGSATPSLESFQGALAGRLTLLELPDRATPYALPAVELIDLRRFRPHPETFLSAPLATALAEVIEAGQQAILFLNRRGFDAALHCSACGGTLRCRHCSVALAHHRARARLLCHYCGYAIPLPRACPACAEEALRPLGLGTEKIEAAIAASFPSARVARLDRDSAGERGMVKILAAMRDRKIDVLVGTQMVAKGHDFPGVTLVGVLLADIGLGLPDFRAGERTFQLLAQVAGRAGRGDHPGRVLIQSWNPDQPSIQHAASHDYRGFATAELATRAALGYPPFGRLVLVRIDGRHEDATRIAAGEIGRKALRSSAGSDVEVLGPVEAPIARLRGRVRFQLLLRAASRTTLRSVARELLSLPLPAGVRLTADVDPASTL